MFPSREGFRLVAKGLTHPGRWPPLPWRGYFSQVSLTRTQVRQVGREGLEPPTVRDDWFTISLLQPFAYLPIWQC